MYSPTISVNTGKDADGKKYAPTASSHPMCATDVGRILRTFKIKKNVEVTDNGKDDF